MTVKRYSFTKDEYGIGYIEGHSHGTYVRFTDYDMREGELLVENERLRSELDEARRALDNLMAAAWPHFQGMREDSDEMKALSKAQQALSALSPKRS